MSRYSICGCGTRKMVAVGLKIVEAVEELRLTLLRAGRAGRVVVANLLVGPVDDTVGAAEAGHVLSLLALEEAGDPGEARDAEVRAHVVEDARVEAAEADLVAVRLDRGTRRLEQLRREGLAEGAVVTVELDDPDRLRAMPRQPCGSAGRSASAAYKRIRAGAGVLVRK